MMRTIRILQCFMFGQEDCYGAEKIMMNLYRHMDRERFQFDFLLEHDIGTVTEEEVFRNMGARFLREQWRLRNCLNHGWTPIVRVLDRHPEIAGIHANMEVWNFSRTALMREAYRRRIPIRIAHSHNACGISNMTLNWWVQHPISMAEGRNYVNYNLACSNAAGKWLHMKQFEVLKNGIDTEAYQFRENVRAQKRRELGLGNQFVVGFVGRLMHQKNPLFLIEMMRQLNRIRPDTQLVIAGDGILREDLVVRARELGVNNYRILGYRNDVSELMQAFDVLVLPSLWEGLAMVSVEGQAAGLRVLLSDRITSESRITDNVLIMPYDAGQWAQVIGHMEPYHDREGAAKVRAAGYDIQRSADRLMEVYESLWTRRNKRVFPN